MSGLLGDLRHGLNPRRTRADHSDTLAFKRHRLMRPLPRMVALARKILDAGDIGEVGRRESTHRADQELSGCGNARAGRHRPSLGRLIVAGTLHPRLELDVATQMEAIGDVFDIIQNIRLLGLGLFPFPILHQIVREGVAIKWTPRTINAGPRIPIIPPGPTHVGGAIIDAHGEAHLAQVMQGIHPAHTGTDNHGVVGFNRSIFRRSLLFVAHSISPADRVAVLPPVCRSRQKNASPECNPYHRTFGSGLAVGKSPR